jgi:hypothetical protein
VQRKKIGADGKEIIFDKFDHLSFSGRRLREHSSAPFLKDLPSAIYSNSERISVEVGRHVQPPLSRHLKFIALHHRQMNF